MNETYFRELVVLASTGLGVAVFGLFQFLAGSSRRVLVAAGWVVGTVGAGVGSAALLDPIAGWAATALTAAITCVTLALGSSWLPKVLSGFQRPGVRAGGLAVVGLALLVGAILRNDVRHEADLDASLDWLERVSERPPTQEVAGLVVTTDQTRRIYPREARQPRSDAELRVLTKDMMAQIPQTGSA